ncbi:MAG: hypothetical protein Q9167_007301 [Letrouitia subvulpina]
MASQDIDPPLLEYARFHGLSRDYQECNPTEELSCLSASLYEDIDTFLEKEDFATVQAVAKSPPTERLDVSRDALELLREVTKLHGPIPRFEHGSKLDLHHVRNLKQELPLLRTDHETDMQDIVRRTEVDLAHDFLPLEHIDVDEDEGLIWPKKYDNLPEEYFKELQNERLDVPKDAFTFLKDVVNFGANREEQPVFECERLSRQHCRKNAHQMKILSPPIPLSPAMELYEPSSETGQLEYVSENPSPVRLEIEELDKHTFRDDNITKSNLGPDAFDARLSSESVVHDEINNIGDVYSSLTDVKETPPLLPVPTKINYKSDLRVEVPVTPVMSIKAPPWERNITSLPKVLSEMIPMSEFPSPIPIPEQTASEDIDTYFEEKLCPIAALAKRAIEQEQLSEGDTSPRVPVPVLDFSRPKAPWDQAKHCRDKEKARKEELSRLQEDHFGNHFWPLDSQAIRELTWVPYPPLVSQYELKEDIVDDGTLERFLAIPAPVDSKTLTWKRDGLQILDEVQQSDEEELEFGDFLEAKDVNSLVRKRKLELQGHNISDTERTSLECKMRRIVAGKQSAEPASGLPNALDSIAVQPKSLTFDFSAAGALENFLSVRKGEERKINPNTADRLSTDHSKFPTTSNPIRKKAVGYPSQLDDDNVNAPLRPSIKLDLKVPTASKPFMVSTAFLINWKLLHQIRALYPSAEFIERDFSLGISLPQMSLHQPAQHSMSSVYGNNEADIILSPNTGLVVTTLQKIKQRALPGITARSPVQEHLQHLALRYGRLIVLVHREDSTSSGTLEGVATGSGGLDLGGLDLSDCEAFASFSSFLGALSCDIEAQLLFIDSKGSNLAEWIVNLMLKYGISSESPIKLLQEETQWEVFLRHVGMNAFAAQIVLAEMKQLREREGYGWGLDTFLRIGGKERVWRFERAIGESKLIRRVGEVLDRRW